MRLQETEISQLKKSWIDKKQSPRIINCRISRGKLISQLDDGREVVIAVSLLTKWSILGENVKPEQLKKNEIKGKGRLIYFPEIDEVLPTWKITEGLFSCN